MTGTMVAAHAVAACCLAAALALAGTVGAETWRGLTVAPEERCSVYDRERHYHYPQSTGRLADERRRRRG